MPSFDKKHVSAPNGSSFSRWRVLHYFRGLLRHPIVNPMVYFWIVRHLTTSNCVNSFTSTYEHAEYVIFDWVLSWISKEVGYIRKLICRIKFMYAIIRRFHDIFFMFSQQHLLISAISNQEHWYLPFSSGNRVLAFSSTERYLGSGQCRCRRRYLSSTHKSRRNSW